MLCFDKLAITYNGKNIIQNFSVTIGPNSLVLLNGRNGSGKTSLLKATAGVLSGYSGKITLDEMDISKNLREYRALISLISHESALQENLTVRENVRFWAKLRKNEMLVDTALVYFSLQDLADVKCKLLSAGQRKRLSLTKLVTDNSLIWLLDEPEINLDEYAKEALLNMITVRVHQEGIVIIASHMLKNLPSSTIIEMEDFRPKYE